jgi:cytochrome c
MFSRRLLVAAAIFFATQLIAETPLSQPASPKLGTPIAAEVNITAFVLPDGTGLPPGSGTVTAGEALYRQHCHACHGAEGVGGINDVLAGGQGTLRDDVPLKTIGSYWPYATTLFDYVRRAMPYTSPGTLSNNDTYALTAYLLHINDILPASADLDAETLAKINMPNRSGFTRRH